jgi:hypothetical protein
MHVYLQIGDASAEKCQGSDWGNCRGAEISLMAVKDRKDLWGAGVSWSVLELMR